MDPIGWFLNFFNTFLGLGIFAIIIIVVIAFLILILIQAFFLYLALKIVDAQKDNFGSVFVTALINSFLLPIPCIGCILAWVVINSRHNTGFGMAIVVWLLSGLIAAAIVIGVVFGLIYLVPLFLP
jgi:hypothetical protein